MLEWSCVLRDRILYKAAARAAFCILRPQHFFLRRQCSSLNLQHMTITGYCSRKRLPTCRQYAELNGPNTNCYTRHLASAESQETSLWPTYPRSARHNAQSEGTLFMQQTPTLLSDVACTWEAEDVNSFWRMWQLEMLLTHGYMPPLRKSMPLLYLTVVGGSLSCST